jgi:Phosphotransferase enzyme family
VKPPAVTRAESLLGLEAESLTPVLSRGYSRSEHWTVVFEGNVRAFLKLARVDPSPAWLRDEVAVYGCVDGPFMPRLLGFEDGPEPLLVLEDLTPGARFPPPWAPGDVDAVLATLSEVAACRAELPRLDEHAISGWNGIASDPEPFLSLGLVSRDWLAAALPLLLDAAAAAPLGGDSVVHCDVRSDNLCLREGRAVLFDWNHASCGNPAFDVAFWLPSLTLEGGPDPRGVSRDADGLAVVVAGFFAAQAGLPPPAGAPRVRGFQLAQLEVALPWACGVLGLPLD